LSATARIPEAEQALQRALAIQQQLADEHPKIAEYRTETADHLTNLAELLANAGRLDDAEQLARRTLSLRKKLMEESAAELPEYRSRMGIAVHDLATVLCEKGNYEEARALAEQAIEHSRLALKASPSNPNFLRQVRGDYVLLAETLLSQADPQKASEAAEAAIRLSPVDCSYYVAAAYARCAPRLDKHPKLNDVARRALVKSVADRAVDHLRTAITKGYPATVKSLRENPELQSLRPIESYQRLIKELEANESRGADPSAKH
jgi:tetratricopeptide (TPR) repeat protein